MSIKLKETSTSLGKVQGKKRWFARLIAAGAGSSGFYTKEALQNTGPAAFPKGTHIHADHDSWRDSDERPEGSIRRMAGIIASEPEYREDLDEVGLYAEVEFSAEWAPFVEQFSEHIGLSVAGSGYGSEVTDTGLDIIEGFIPHPLNRVDLVTRPGAKGKIIEALESYKGEPLGIKLSESGTLVLDETFNRKENGVTPEDIAQIAEALAKAIRPAFAELQEALTPAPPVETDGAVEVDNSEVSEALIAANLPEAARNKVYEAIKAGTKVTEAIATEQEYIKSLKEAANISDEGPEGKIKNSIRESATSGVLTVSGW